MEACDESEHPLAVQQFCLRNITYTLAFECIVVSDRLVVIRIGYLLCVNVRYT